MVFQAVAEYYQQVTDRQNVDLDVELSVSGRSRPIRWRFSKDNAHLTRSDKVNFKLNIMGQKNLLLCFCFIEQLVERELYH